MTKSVLLIEDEEGLRVSLADRLASEGYDVYCAEDGEIGFTLATRECFDLIVLDVRLPLRDGFDVCRNLRRGGSTVPILMLTARAQLDDRVLGLKLGADDYVVKPFETVELLARMEALLRRTSGGARINPSPEAYEFGGVRVDLIREQVSRQRIPLAILPLEYRLLRYFIQHRHVTLSRQKILNDVWGYDSAPVTRTVDVHVSGLRQKIEPDSRHPRYLLTVHRRGYKFVG
jgi:DNA-binding response OmpR family regulator